MSVATAGPYPPRPPVRSSTASIPTISDPYYGHADTAHLCRRFITSLFSCPDRLPPTAGSNTPTLGHFIAYALHRTRLHASVTFTALFLLSRLKSRFPAARGSSGHRLFISAFMIASKVVCDDTYSNKSWTVVGQGMFSLREINQMEREMCGYLEWMLNVDPNELREFETRVRKDYGPNGTCPPYYHPPATSTPAPPATIEVPPVQHHVAATTTTNNNIAPTPITPPDSPRRVSLPPMTRASSLQGKPRGQAPVVDTHMATPPLAKDTPSPASSAACRTPQSDDETDDPTTIVSGDYNSEASGDYSRATSAMSMKTSATSKSRNGRDQAFAFPSRTVW